MHSPAERAVVEIGAVAVDQYRHLGAAGIDDPVLRESPRRRRGPCRRTGIDLHLHGEVLPRVARQAGFRQQVCRPYPGHLHRLAFDPANRAVEAGQMEVSLQFLQPAYRFVAVGGDAGEVEVFREPWQVLEEAQRGAADERHRARGLALVQPPHDERLHVLGQGVESALRIFESHNESERPILHNSTPAAPSCSALHVSQTSTARRILGFFDGSIAEHSVGVVELAGTAGGNGVDGNCLRDKTVEGKCPMPAEVGRKAQGVGQRRRRHRHPAIAVGQGIHAAAQRDQLAGSTPAIELIHHVPALFAAELGDRRQVEPGRRSQQVCHFIKAHFL